MKRTFAHHATTLVGGLLALTAFLLVVPRATNAQQGGDAVATLADNTWRQLDVAPSTRYLTPGYVVTETPIAEPNPRTRAYSGLVAGGNRLFYFGGGHRSYPGNDVEVFDPTSLRWEQSYKPEVCPYTPSEPCYALYSGWGVKLKTPLGRPYTEHTYQDYAYDPLHNRLLVLLASGTWAYDLASKRWTPLAGAAAGNTFSPYGPAVGLHHLFGFDQGLGGFQAVVTGGENRGTYRFDDATGRWFKRGAPPEAGWTQLYSTYAHDQGIHFVYAFAWTRRWWKYDARSDQWTPLAAPPAVPDSFDYDSRNGVVVAVNHSTADALRVMVFDPRANSWTQLPGRTPAPSMSMGMHAAPMAWRYVASRNVFIFLAGRYDPAGGRSTTWGYRYKGDVGPAMPGSDATSPTVTLQAPAPGARVSGTIQLSAQASDNVGVVAVSFRVNGNDVGAVATAAPYTIAWNTTSVADGTHTLSAVGRDAAGNVTVSAPVVITVAQAATAPVTPPTPLPLPAPPSSTPTEPLEVLSFEQRCAVPGVVRCFGFDSPTEIEPYVTAAAATPVVDTSVKASGAGSLRMTIPSRSPANASGVFALNFTPGSFNASKTNTYPVQFGEGQEFYVQWRQRFASAFLSTKFAGGVGWNQIVVGEGDRPGQPAPWCSQLGLVVNDGYYRGFPQIFHGCGRKDGRSEWLFDVVQQPGRSAVDYKLQNAVEGCLYSSVAIPPCVGYKANEWMTFQLHVKVGTWYRNDKNYHRNSLVELWVAENGKPSRLVMSKHGYDLANENPAAKYGKVWLMPYNGGKDPNVTYPVTHTWYDELIVSRARIPDPVGSAPQTPPVVADTIAPAAPTNLSASVVSGQVRLAWSPSSDNVQTTGYIVSRDGVTVGATAITAYTDTPSAGRSYVFAISATDAVGNVSAPSRSVTATVPASTGTGGSTSPTPSPDGGTTTPPPSTPPPSGTGLSFAERCSQPGVVRCFGFNSDPEVAPFIRPSGDRKSKPSVDTSVRASGGGALKMTIPSLSGADTSGAFEMNFTPGSLNQTYAGGDPGKGAGYYSVQFGEGDEFYVQWRQRFSPEFIATHYAGGGGWKTIIVGEGDREGFKASSCTQLELVVNNGNYSGFPRMYHSCGDKDGQYQGLYDYISPQETGKSSGDWKLQNAIDGCRYTSPTVPPCVGFKANQWMTFQMRVKIGTWYLNDKNYHRDSLVELWVAEEGQPSRLVISMSGYDLANQNPAAKYGKVWLLPYNTGKDATVSYPETYTWYDDLIISRTRIPDP